MSLMVRGTHLSMQQSPATARSTQQSERESMKSAIKNFQDALAVILRSGANTDIINYDGDAPLHVAARSGDQVFRLLIIQPQ